MRHLGWVLLLGACTLDPRTVIDKAALHVQVKDIPTGGSTLVLTAADAQGRQLVKRPRLEGAPSIEVIFEEGSLSPGDLDIGAVVLSPTGVQLACGAGRSAAGSTFTLFVFRANDDGNCGGCGKTCTAPSNATVACNAATAACAPFVCAPGWHDVNGDPRDGCETTCASPMAEETTAACRNGVDDDCDGQQDCVDSACQGQTRPCGFGACQGKQTWDCATDTWGTCTANEGLENTVAACSNGADDDCDGKTDCADEACNGFTQACTLMTCSGTQAWNCASKTFGACLTNQALETSAAACTDGLDNDCDGQADCADTACVSLPDETAAQCADGKDNDCDAKVDCADPGCVTHAESTPALCGDGMDNDCDGQVDCADPDCANNGGEAVIAVCSDGKDNDCDGKSDCQDTDCTNIRQGCGGNICASGLKLWLCSAQLFAVCVPYIALPETSDLLCGDNLDNDCDAKTDCADDNCLGKGCGGNRKCCANGTCSATCG